MRRQFAVTLTAMTASQTGWSTWVSGAISPRRPALPSEDVELAPALVDRGAEAVEGVVILEIERHEGRRRSGGADLVVELLERALRARERDHMRAGAREGERRGAADAARGAGHHREAVRERLVHGAEP